MAAKKTGFKKTRIKNEHRDATVLEANDPTQKVSKAHQKEHLKMADDIMNHKIEGAVIILKKSPIKNGEKHNGMIMSHGLSKGNLVSALLTSLGWGIQEVIMQLLMEK